MADKTMRLWDSLHEEYIDVLYKDNGNGTYSPSGGGTSGPFAGLTDAQLRASSLLVANPALGLVTDAAIITDIDGSISAKLRGLIKLLINKITVKLDSGENYLGTVGGKSALVGIETIRPADVIPYSAGDVVSTTTSDSSTTPLLALPVGRINGGSGYLMKFRLSTDQKLCTASFRIHLYTVSAPSTAVPGDNLAMSLFYTNKAQRLGYIDMPPMSTSLVNTNSTMAVSQDLSSHMKFKCASGDTNIYYLLETLSAFTPASGQKFYFEVLADQD